MSVGPAPAPPASVSTSPAPAARPFGLRGGLSFLRSYSHSLQAHAGASTGQGRPRAVTAASAPTVVSTTTSTSASISHSASTPPLSPAFADDTVLPDTVLRPAFAYAVPQAPPPTPQSPPSDAPVPPATMTRTRAETAAPQLAVRNMSGPTPAVPSVSSTPAHDASADQPSHKHLPSIRFICHQDPRAPRPSLQFSTVQRTLPDESHVIRVGRYSERDNIPETPAHIPSAAAVGFKSKVVSRKHCELWCKDGSWYIKDVKSSSGTFLNHIRLSQPNVESKPFRLKDGDIIQLGIDFRGGEEMIFRCVKIRIECNRGWQQALNTFNKQTHKRLRDLGKARKDGDNASTHTSECSICLMSIAPCQSLFVAPCSHVWHYKCIRPILNGPTWPNFLCPNCRAVADLEADVEDPGEFETWDDDVEQTTGADSSSQQNRHVTPKSSTNALCDSSSSNHAHAQQSLSDLEAAISNIVISESLNGIANQPVSVPTTPQRNPPLAASSSVTQPVSINITGANESSGLSPLFQHTTVTLNGDRAPEGPMTPRNDAGPFVLDGSAGRNGGQRLREGAELERSSPSTGAPVLPPVQID